LLVLLFFIVKNYNTKGSAPDQMIRGRALFVGMNFVTSPFVLLVIYPDQPFHGGTLTVQEGHTSCRIQVSQSGFLAWHTRLPCHISQ